MKMVREDSSQNVLRIVQMNLMNSSVRICRFCSCSAAILRFLLTSTFSPHFVCELWL